MNYYEFELEKAAKVLIEELFKLKPVVCQCMYLPHRMFTENLQK